MTAAPSIPRLDTVGPCDWPVDGCDDCDDYVGLDPQVQAMIDEVATGLLWARTGRVYGLCEVTVRPCRDDCATAASGPWWPSRADGEWVNRSVCGCPGACGCGSAPAQVTLPGPVAAIVDVVVDGVAIVSDGEPAGVVRVDNYRHVVREDGEAWPACVHMGDPAPGGWSITYLHGAPVPPAGAWAAGALACELAKACAGSPCRLPRNVTSVVRQGVTVTRSDLDALVDAGRFGLYEVDLWVASAQPDVASHMLAPSTPDITPPRWQTWP